MLYIVLILVLAALGGVVTALITADSLWAWISIALSALAGVVLFVDWLRRRSAARPGTDHDADETTEPGEAGDAEDAEDVTAEAADTEADAGETVKAGEFGEPEAAAKQQTALLPAAGELRSVGESDEGAGRVPDGEPAEEETDAADLLVVTELDDEVVVVDEHPRYHLTECDWLADRDIIPIAVSEARELGFTPCARCGPDATLAAAHRRKGKSRADR
ncbi:hypothetical protein SAMN05421810_106111 [Amycolatopsis arida]|uniref:Uncharacterized protein n=1 Tax=Amycolatopsis arida TaxID=587909 RepID=A0A1I5XK00_9PSEU|nr:hypothetical protein [Amycolatopsis arida]TDX97407.1 hypothetical protein CLV69_102510 [Amycolatopsis arida]SFQ32126.1 hypothetical protein SAMN05421810_106111 [Amycolatopsis arida]